MAQFAEKAPVAAIDGKGDTTEIADKVVSGTSVDVVDRLSGRDLLVTPGDIDGMGRKDMFTATESMLKLQIVVIAMAILFPIILACGIFQYFSTVGIDAHAYYATLAVVGIEGDVILGVRADIAHLDVVREEGRADQIRLADDFKFSFIHKHRIFSAATLLQLKSGAKVDIKKTSLEFRDSFGNDGIILGFLGLKWE